MENGTHGSAFVRIAILVEGKTEIAFRQPLIKYLRNRLHNQMPTLKFFPENERIPKEEKLKRKVSFLLNDQKQPFDAVIALSDVYTGTSDFEDAKDAKTKMSTWVGVESRFYPHVALHDFEAWLLPYWDIIQRLAQSNRASPGANPERVNDGKPPSKVLAEIFEAGKGRDSYSKTRDATRILQDQSLQPAIDACPELKAFVNTIIRLSGGVEV